MPQWDQERTWIVSQIILFSHLNWLFTYIFPKSLDLGYSLWEAAGTCYTAVTCTSISGLLHQIGDWEAENLSSGTARFGVMDTWNMMGAWTAMVVMGVERRKPGMAYQKKWQNLGTDYIWGMRIKSTWKVWKLNSWESKGAGERDRLVGRGIWMREDDRFCLGHTESECWWKVSSEQLEKWHSSLRRNTGSDV